jgi:hypothetical protein
MHGTARIVDAFSSSQQNDFPLRSMLNTLQLKPKVRDSRKLSESPARETRALPRFGDYSGT